MSTFQRVKPRNNSDIGKIQNHVYNELAGADKIIVVGPKLKSIGDISTQPKYFGMGKTLAFWSLSMGSTITMGKDNTVTSLALGSGGIPLKQNDYTYLSTGLDSYVISSSSSVICFEIEDATQIEMLGTN
jgi:hypothetical protein